MPIPVISAIAAAIAPSIASALPALTSTAIGAPTAAYLLEHAEDIKPYANRILTSLRDDVTSIIKPTAVPVIKADSKSLGKGDIQYRTLPYAEVISRTTPPSSRVQIDLSRTMDDRLRNVYPIVTSELNPEFFKVRLLNSSEPLTVEWDFDQSALVPPAPNVPEEDPKDNKKDQKNDQDKKKNPFKQGWKQAQNNSPEKWHNSWSSLAEKIGYGANKFWQFETSPLGVLSNMLLIGSGTGAYFGLKDNNETSEPVQKTNTPREEDYISLKDQWRLRDTHKTSTDSLKNNKGGY